MENIQWSMVGWVVAACVLGFGISAVFAGWMKFSRRFFLFPYVLLTVLFLIAFFARNEVDAAGLLRQNWQWGILAGGLLSLVLAITVRRQPKSREATGAGLFIDLAWAGFVYGLVDALFLNVLPVVAVQLAMSPLGWATSLGGKIAVGAIGLFASLLVTLTYHLGYPEFRNKRVGLVLAGNSLITLAFLLSANPFGSLISHTAMHIAAVMQGSETTVQLPPHYPSVVAAE